LQTARIEPGRPHYRQNSHRFLATGFRSFLLWAVACLPAGALYAQIADPAPLAAQRAAITAMQQSIERQKESVLAQTGNREAQNFFVLPALVPEHRLAPAPAAPVASAGPACEPLPAPVVQGLVRQAAARHDLDENLLLAVMNAESGFRPCAVS